MLQENKYYSYNKGNLAKGCQFCVRGEKLVLFVTGICPRKCYFCPLSDEKYGFDVTFANERKVADVNDVLHEAERMKATGAGITGGDPLAKLDRTITFIQALKTRYGKQFHIHLYTSLVLVTKETLQRLYDAGLDEIRFHPDLESQEFWQRLSLAKDFSWDVGVEIPLIPGKEQETKALLDYIHDKIDFVNLNELEIADNKLSKLLDNGFKVKSEFSYAVAGSMEMGLEMIRYVQEKGYPLPVHLCTAKLKDGIQLNNRLRREGKNVKKKFDLVDKDGLLTRGALYFEDLAPGFGYRKKLAVIDKQLFMQRLNPIYLKLKQQCSLKDDDLFLDSEKPRILLSVAAVQKHKAKILALGLLPAIVKEYPTADQLEIEVEFLT